MKNKNIIQQSLKLHRRKTGKLSTKPTFAVNQKTLPYFYSPGVSHIVKAIAQDPNKIYDFTNKKNTIAILTNGTAVLGLGNVGADAALPVMESKAVLLAKLANINAVPICINSTNINEIIQTMNLIKSNFGAIMLEDIASPLCFELEEKLQEKLQIPVIHDDRRGTAIVIVAALLNACKLYNQKLTDLKFCFAGLGSAATGTIELLTSIGVSNIIAFDEFGPLKQSTIHKQNPVIQKLVKDKKIKLVSEDVQIDQLLHDCNVFIGLSTKNVLTMKMIKAMCDQPWILALANPDPEINPYEAKKAQAALILTGSHYSQDFGYINNALAFPGIFKSVLEHKLPKLTLKMQYQAAHAMANSIKKSQINNKRLLPSLFHKKIISNINKALTK